MKIILIVFSLISRVLKHQRKHFFSTLTKMLMIISLLSGTVQVLATEAAWILNQETSTIHFISVKKEHVGEVSTFKAASGLKPALNASIDGGGNAVFAVDLNKVQTGIAIRNERLVKILFEAALLPVAYFSLMVDVSAINAMSVGDTSTENISGSLSIHGVKANLQAQVLVIKKSANDFSVASLKPVLIDTKQFDMASGLMTLANIAKLTSIGQVVPVYFNLDFSANTDSTVEAIDIAIEPMVPSALTADFDVTSLKVELNWQDNSTNETAFILRRKITAGLWETSGNLAADTVAFSEGLPDTGEFNYKVIAVNGSVPSAPSNETIVTVTEADPIVIGQSIYINDCAGCHGLKGEGVGLFPAVNTARNVEAMITAIIDRMPEDNPARCDRSCAEKVAAYIQTLWAVELACDKTVSPVNYGARQLKILTRTEYQRSVEDLVGIDFDTKEGLSADLQVGLFFNNTHASMVATIYSNFLSEAEKIAKWSASKDFYPVLSCTSYDTQCASRFVTTFIPKVFRRDLLTEESTQYNAIAKGDYTNGDVKKGIQMAMEAALSSPQFLYRHELGELNSNNSDIDSDAFELTSYEMATFLSYTLNGTTPDDELLQVARNNLLRTPSEILKQAKRLTAKNVANNALDDFVDSWLGTAKLQDAAKDVSNWPNFSNVVPHLKSEVRHVFSNVMLDEREKFAAIYDANYTFVNQSLATHYGMDAVSGNTMRKVATNTRGGVLANGAFMARWAESKETSPILRSVRVRRRMLCQDQPDPPAGTFEAREAKLKELADLLKDPKTTNRLKYHRLTEDKPCTNCHLEYINPLGFGMEDFDTVGISRSKDLNGNVISASGVLYAPNKYQDVTEKESFSGAKGLGKVLANLPSAQACLAKQLFRFYIGVGHNAIDVKNPDGPKLSVKEMTGYACEIDNLKNKMLAESPKAMLESFSVLEAVRYRKAWPRN